MTYKPITTPGEMLEAAIAVICKRARYSVTGDFALLVQRTLEQYAKDVARIAPEASPPPAADRARFIAISHAVCLPTCRENFDGKHAAWCPGRIVMDCFDDEKASAPPEPDNYTLPYVEGPIPPEPAQQHGELRERIVAMVTAPAPSDDWLSVVGYVGMVRALLRDCLAALSAPPRKP